MSKKNKLKKMMELLDKRTRTSKTYLLETLSDGRKKFVLDSSINSIHYKNSQDKWKDINLSKKISDQVGFDYLVDEAPYKLYISDKGARRFYPDRNKPDYLEFAIPSFLNNKTGIWDGNKLVWTNPNFNVNIILGNDGVKFLAVIKKPVSFDSLSFPITISNISFLKYIGNLEYWDTPTGNFQVGASLDDTYVKNATESNNPTAVDLFVGEAGGNIYDSGYRWTGITIEDNSTIDVAYISLYLDFIDSSGTIKTIIYFEDVSSPK